jgi:tetratricopeptide (TPR) repeat protein
MANLATLYLDRGQLDEGISLMEETLRLQRATLGADHPSTLQNMNNLANAYGRSGNLERATSLVEETLRRRIALLGESHPDTLFAKASLGACYRDAGRLDKAIPLLEEAYFKRGRVARLQKVSGSLLKAYILAGAKEKALALMETRVKAMRSATPSGSTRLAGNLAINALNLLRLEAWEEAEPVIRECLKIREKQMPDSWLTFNSKGQLGAALLGQGKLEEAEPLLLEGYNGMREREDEIPAAGKVRLQEALSQLVKLYEVWDKPAEADRWRAILDDGQPAEDPPTPTTEARGQAAEPGETLSEAESVGVVQEED